ncbi:hypothetical protein [Flavobacterium sp.]|uniref:hypothetical protein n=1 Tax=Flavobacterium sp. TaxID=239 RepID=UPI002604AE59|nr:hypothetical protein [Flavobacterium sp.]
MRINYKKWGIIIGVVALGYLIGLVFPYHFFQPSFNESDPITKAEYYRIVIAIISAMITFCAMIVALFKDDFREYWKRPKIKFIEPSNLTIEDKENSESENATSESHIIVNKYISRIEVLNEGNLPAQNAEIYLDNLTFTPKNSSIQQHVETTSTALEWNGNGSSSIIIPPGGKKLVRIAEITAPEKFSTPDSTQTAKAATITIGDLESTEQKGTWKAKFTLYAQNHRPTSFDITIEWDGQWKSRLTEFKNHCMIKKI